MQLTKKKIWWILVVVGLSLWIGNGWRSIAHAQAPDGTWMTPLNLSQSGATSEPRLVVDSQGVVHVIWNDEYAGMVYMRLDGDNWSAATPVTFPFDEIPPVLLADRAGFVHAFWLTDTNNLFYSRSLAASLALGGWTPAILLASGVGRFNIALSDSDGLHLAYIRTAEELQQPAGVYYLSSSNRGDTWQGPRLLYPSKYLRSLEVESLNVQIDTARQGENDAVYVAWDDPALKRVFLASSPDSGLNWFASQEVDSPEANTVTRDPFGVRVQADGDQILLIWQAGLQSGFACTQYYRSSVDGGATWSQNRVMLGQLVGCAQENRLYPASGADRYTLLYTMINDEVYLAAWNGQEWSDLQPQRAVERFTDPVTRDAVSFRCRQPALGEDGRLYVVGCDTIGEVDIWMTWRELGGIGEWFPPPAVWSLPTTIASSQLPITQLSALSDPAGRFHVFWLQEEVFVTSAGEQQTRSGIYYQRLEGETWSPAVKILSSPDNYAQHMTVARSTGEQVYLVWEGGTSGRVYFSRANLALAESPFEWSKPQEVPLPQPTGETEPVGWAPDLAVDASGVIHVVYARPVNQGRGIYLVSSRDGGETWSEPRLVFDAETAGWSMVSSPKLAVGIGAGGATTGAQPLHLIYTQNTIVGNGRVLGVYYLSSQDGGETWGLPSQVVDKPVRQLWLVSAQPQSSGVPAAGTVAVHRFWIGAELGALNLYQQTSLDGGTAWGAASSLTRLAEIPGPLSLVPSPVQPGELTLFQISGDSTGNLELAERSWSNGRWITGEGQSLGLGTVDDYLALASALGSDGQAYLVYLVENDASEVSEQAFELIFTSHAASGIEITAGAETPQPEASTPGTAPTPAAESTAEPTQSEQVLLQPSVTPTTVQQPQNTQPPNMGWFNTTTGLFLAAFQAVIVIGAGYLFIRYRQRGRL